MTEKLKHYEDGFTTTTEKDGGREQEAVVNTEPGEVHSPEILAKDVKEIVAEADREQDEHLLENYYDKDEMDELYYDKEETNELLATKQDVIDDESVESGSVASMLGLDDEGNLVKGSVPAGSVVDEALDVDSTNPVENKAIAQVIDDIKTGQTVVAKAQTAKQLDNVGPDSGTTQEEPFIFQATATENGMSPDTETAPIAKQLEKQGNSVVVNQLVKNPDFSSEGEWARSSSDYGTLSISSGVATWTCTTQPTAFHQTGIVGSSNYMSIPYNHKVLAIARVRSSIAHTVAIYGMIGGENTYYYANSVSANTWTLLIGLISDRASADKVITRAKVCFSGDISDVAVNTTLEVDYCYFIDLTQWGFTADELTDITTTPSHFFRYYAGSLAYNAGTLTNANSRYLDCIGRNQFDEVWQTGTIDNTGAITSSSSYCVSTNLQRLIPGAEYHIRKNSGYNLWFYYYDKDGNYIPPYSSSIGASQKITGIPSNAFYYRIVWAGTTYANDITISLYYEDGTGYDQYYPYVKNSYDTGTETLLSAGSVRDVKLPSGEITHKVDTLTLDGSSDEGWSLQGTETNYVRFAIPRGTAKAGTSNVKNNWGYDIITIAPSSSDTGMKIWISPSYINVFIPTSLSISTVSAFETYLSSHNLVLNFELDTYTTEEGTSFAENVEVDNYGSMSWRSATTPQGCKFFYPADYVEFIDSIGMRDDIEFDASKIASTTQLASEETARQGQDTILLNAIGGTLRQILATSKSIDFLNTNCRDMGSLSWSALGNNVFYAYVSDIVQTATTNMICTLYKTSSAQYWVDIGNNTILKLGNDLEIRVKDTSCATVDEFTNKVKGVLLAYEKASE